MLLGCPRPDEGAPSCRQLGADIERWLQTHRSCQGDADCTLTLTGCGTSAVCGVYTHREAAGPQLSALVDAFKAKGCDKGKPCPGCAPPRPAACVEGFCAAAPAEAK